MKKPSIESCPCCEARTANAKPVCINVHQEVEGIREIVCYVLHWECCECGCEWADGQFAQKETRPTSPFISIAAGSTMTIDGRKFDVLEVTAAAPNPSGEYDIKIALS